MDHGAGAATGAPASLGLSDLNDHRTLTVEGQSRLCCGAGSLLQMEPIRAGVGLEVRILRLEFAPMAPEVQQALQVCDPWLAPVEVHRALFDPSSGTLIAPPQWVWRGWAERLQVTEDDAAVARLDVASAARALTRTLRLRRSEAALQAIAAVNQRISASYNNLTAMASATAFAEALSDGIREGFVFRTGLGGLLDLVSVQNGTSGPTTTGRIRADHIRLDGNVQVLGDFVIPHGMAAFGGVLQSTIYQPDQNGAGWSVNRNGAAQFGTLALRNGAISRIGVASGVHSATVQITLPHAGWVTAIASFTQGTNKKGHLWRLNIGGQQVQTERPVQFRTGAMTGGRFLQAGTHGVTVACDTTTGDARCGVTAFGLMR